MKRWLLIGLLAAPAAMAAPRIENVVVKPDRASFSDGKPPQVEVAVTVSRPKIARAKIGRVGRVFEAKTRLTLPHPLRS